MIYIVIVTHKMNLFVECLQRIRFIFVDLFFTRVSPSKLFDVLADDFNYALVSSVLVGMLCVAIVTRKLSSRRLLKAAWQ